MVAAAAVNVACVFVVVALLFLLSIAFDWRHNNEKRKLHSLPKRDMLIEFFRVGVNPASHSFDSCLGALT